MRITLSKKVGAAIAVAAMTLAFAGCGQKTADQQQQAANDSAAQQANALPGTDWVRADADQVQDGGTLTKAISQLPTNWNYYNVSGALYDLAQMMDPMGIDGQFLMSDEKGNIKLNPDYVESAELISTDPQIVKVKYNKNAKWDDGTPITIKDFEAQWKANNGSNPAYLINSSDGWESIESVTQTDDEFTGEIKYKETYADWIGQIYPQIPQSVTKDPDSFNKGFTAKNTPGAGPFKVDTIDTKGGVVTMKRNPLWWGAKPKLDTIIFKVTSQQQTSSSFANSELDVLEIANVDEYKTAKGREDAEIKKTNGLTWTHVTLMAGSGPLKDLEVRKAIAYAINRDAIAQSVVGGLEAPVVLQNNIVFVPGQTGYEDSYEGKLKYDPEQAKKILDDAGWKAGSDGKRSKDGQTLKLAITVPADTKSNITRAEQIQKNLNDIGFDISLRNVPSDKYFDPTIQTKDFNMVTFSWVGTLFPMASAGNVFADSGQNYTGYTDPEVDDLNKQMLAELDQTKRVDIADQLSKKAVAGYTVIPFYATPNVWAIKKGLVNYGPSQLETVDWTKVGYSADAGQ